MLTYPMEEPIETTIMMRDATYEEVAEVWGEGIASSGIGDACLVIVLGNGDRIFPSRDYEGNGPGVFFGITHDGKNIAFS